MTFIAWIAQLHVACGRTSDSIVRTLRINQLVLKSSHMPSNRDWTAIEVATMALTYFSQVGSFSDFLLEAKRRTKSSEASRVIPTRLK
jgi:hypothetical protein